MFFKVYIIWLHANVLNKKAIKILRTNDEITKKCIRMKLL